MKNDGIMAYRCSNRPGFPGRLPEFAIRCPSALLALMLLTFSCSRPVEPEPPPNILLIVIDSLRAANLSSYGYHRYTTPTIDSLAAEGTLWTNCISQSSWTLPSFASIFTGTTEISHGAGNRNGTSYMVNPETPFLSDILREMGYTTYAHFNIVFLGSEYGFDRGFDSYRCEPGMPVSADAVTERFADWLDTLGTEAPFFAVLHLYDPHVPYDPPEGYKGLFGPMPEEYGLRWEMADRVVLNPEDRQQYLDLYDGEIAFADDELGRLFRRLRSAGADTNTVIIVTADHGEEFIEHGGIGHGHAFYQEVIHVPLVISGPGIPSGLVDSSWTGLFDIAPTIMVLAGADVSEVMEGLNLLGELPEGRIIPSSGLIHSPEDLLEPWESAVVTEGVKTLRFIDSQGYLDLRTDLSVDPFEQDPDTVDNCGLADAYSLQPRIWEPVEVEYDENLNPFLKDLGYF